MSKLVRSIREAIALSGLKDGMTVSFHHHLRNGDFVLNMVMEEILASRISMSTPAPCLMYIRLFWSILKIMW